jgi:Bromodomain
MLDAVDEIGGSRFFYGPPEAGLPDDKTKEYPNLEISRLIIRVDLLDGQYSSIMAFTNDVNLCFENAKKFCQIRYADVYKKAMDLQKAFSVEQQKI